MTIKDHPAAQCLGKHAFETRAKAAQVAHRHNGSRREDVRDRAMVPYRCPHCHQFHLGHAIRRMR